MERERLMGSAAFTQEPLFLKGLYRKRKETHPGTEIPCDTRVRVLLRPALCDPMDCSPPGSVHGIPRQGYWSGLLCSPPGDLPDPGLNPGLLQVRHWQAGLLLLGSQRRPLSHVGC